MLEERTAEVVPAGNAREFVVRLEDTRKDRSPWPRVVGYLTIGAVAIVALVMLGGWFGFRSLFQSKTIDRSAPVLVDKLRDLSQFRGASGTYSTTIDLEHKHGIVPTFIAGDHTIYSAVGNVDATVDLRKIALGTTARRSDGTLVLALPHARLGEATLDSAKSHVMSRDRGVLDRVGGIVSDSPTSERSLERVGEARIAKAARDGDLRKRAERNTATMIKGLAKALGAGPVRVEFV
jgi:Protein of unknown function (DUF4230)